MLIAIQFYYAASSCQPLNGTTKANSESSPSVLWNDVIFYCNDDTILSGEFRATCIRNNFQLQCFPDILAKDANTNLSNTSMPGMHIFKINGHCSMLQLISMAYGIILDRMS